MGKVLHLHYFQGFSQQLFFFFVLIVLVWTSSTLSNRWVREDILALFLVLGEKHSVFHIQSLSMILAVGFLQRLFIRWGSSLLFLVSWMFFIMNRCWCVLSSVFLCLLKWSCGFCHWSFYWCGILYTDCFSRYKSNLNPWDKSHLVVVCHPFHIPLALVY